ncbi:PREDICTED: golgin subfamily A member 1-like isoform X1 [Polistes dominula]|uniref:Golgin subfamily A member 1-like isoform X1 n=1 Tax=Polistes dominula TaxID=743375 RepID=A0ABM1I4S2_POLDO|nr:PREDICTED: golgin subfamily A member 1-like isoform X1 [Polistes dominula]
MFASLKNKIREEIGSDVSTVVRNAANIRNISSRHVSQTGSTSSISESQTSLDGSRDEHVASSSSPISKKQDNNFSIKLSDSIHLKDIKNLDNQEEEWHKFINRKEMELQKKIEKINEEWKIKLSEKDREWKKIIEKQEKDKIKLETELQATESSKKSLELALRDAEEYKKKLYNFQEDAEQLESYQTQEMAKIKHLLLSKEQEVEEKSQHLKVALAEIESLKSEVSRLRRYEDDLNNIQDEMETLRHSTQREKAKLSCKLAQTEEVVRHLKDKVFVLEQRGASDTNDPMTNDERIADLMRERTLLDRKLEEAHLHLSDIKTSWSGKIACLETQVGRLSRQAGEEGLERRRVEEEKEKLKQRIKQLEAEIEVNNVVMATKDAKLLRMAEDIDEMATELKELRASVDDEEFKRQIETSTNECNRLKSELEETTEKLSAATSELTYLRSSNEDMRSNNSSLHLEINLLKESLENEKQMSAKLQECIEKEKNEKDSALLRSAQFSQDIEIIKQEQRLQEAENHELQNKMDILENNYKAKNEELEKVIAMLKKSKQKIIELEEVERNKEKMEKNEKILLDLEEQINEKTKTIKVLKQRLTDMKKTLQRELRVPSASLDNDAESSTAILNPSSSKTVTAKHVNLKDDVNFKYLKHVLIKFLTSREYEALHLTKAVATLLHFSPEEERLLQQTLEWKMSWFGTRPNLGFGQTAKAIPPS